MSNGDCVFCKIIAREISTDVVDEDEYIIVIKDKAPKAPIHFLLIPKKHVQDIVSLEEVDKHIPAALFKMAAKLAKKLPDQSFRLIANNGREAGQSVFHLHTHFLSGKKMDGF